MKDTYMHHSATAQHFLPVYQQTATSLHILYPFNAKRQ